MANISLDLYQLVSKLTKNEKSFFKKITPSTSKQAAIEFALFDMINKLFVKLEINADFESRVKEEFVKKYRSENLAKFKNSLFQKLLFSLSRTEVLSDDALEVLQQATYVNILLSKGLFNEAKRVLRRMETKALALNDLSLKAYFRELSFRAAYLNGDYGLLPELTTKRLEVVGEYFDNIKLVSLHNRVFALIQGGDKEKDSQRDQIKLEAYALDWENKQANYQFNYFSLLRNLAFMEKDVATAIKHMEAMILIHKEHPELFLNQEKVIISLYADIISYGFELDDNSYFEKYIAIIDSWESSIPSVSSYKLTQLIRLKSLNVFYSKRIEEILELEDSFWSSIGLFSEHMRVAVVDCFIYAYYLLNKYDKIFMLVNEQLQIQQKTHELRKLTELIQLAVNFEAGLMETVSSKLRTLERQESFGGLPEDKVVLNFFRQAIKEKNVGIVELAEDALSALEALNFVSLKYSFDFRIWLKALINGSTYQMLWKQQNDQV